ncbi:SLOG family protein [Rossellomorea marisflavi]|uniref:SLOG family protein n=1 Tax=Rossellomorea marisflavi TaxID=189381 RepID=UPI003FA0BB7B
MTKSCCFTGHRPNKLHGYNPVTEGNSKMLWKLRELIIDQIENNHVDTFITGMALGIDMWAGRIVLKLKEKYPSIKLIAAVPCLNHSGKWNQASKNEWQHIIDKCDKVHYVSNEAYTAWCMQKRNEWMVDNADYVIAVWDGTKGGTGNCVNYARKKNKSITSLHPMSLEVV